MHIFPHTCACKHATHTHTHTQANLLPSAEAVCAVPNALVALCLNTFGLQRVRETQVLQVLVQVFSSRRYMRAVAGDAPRVLGSGLEELFRWGPHGVACLGLPCCVARLFSLFCFLWLRGGCSVLVSGVCRRPL